MLGFAEELVAFLGRGGIYTDACILANLNIDSSNVDLVKVMSDQLEACRVMSLWSLRAKGWKWKS